MDLHPFISLPYAICVRVAPIKANRKALPIVLTDPNISPLTLSLISLSISFTRFLFTLSKSAWVNIDFGFLVREQQITLLISCWLDKNAFGLVLRLCNIKLSEEHLTKFLLSNILAMPADNSFTYFWIQMTNDLLFLEILDWTHLSLTYFDVVVVVGKIMYSSSCKKQQTLLNIWYGENSKGKRSSLLWNFLCQARRVKRLFFWIYIK